MSPEPVTEPVEDLQVNETPEEAAPEQAEGEQSEAEVTPLDAGPKYLFIKVKFYVASSNGDGGLIFICVEKGSDTFNFFRSIVEPAPAWVDGISVQNSPESFHNLFRNYFDSPKLGSMAYDAGRLDEALQHIIKPISFFSFLETEESTEPVEEPEGSDISDQPEVSAESEPVAVETDHESGTDVQANVLEILHSMICAALEDFYMKRIEPLEVDCVFYTQMQYDEMLETLGLKPREKTKEEKIREEEASQVFKLYLKGRFTIDPVGGTPVQQLKAGDIVYCEIADRSEVAKSAAHSIGAYKRGLWLPIRGVILEITKSGDDHVRVRLKIGPGMYLDALAFASLRVRCRPLSIDGQIQEATSQVVASNPMSLVIGLVLIAVVVVVIVMALQ